MAAQNFLPLVWHVETFEVGEKASVSIFGQVEAEGSYGIFMSGCILECSNHLHIETIS